MFCCLSFLAFPNVSLNLCYNYLFADAQRCWVQEFIGKDTPVSDLSYGEQRQIKFILGLASKQKLSVLDEPSSWLTIAEITDMVGTF